MKRIVILAAVCAALGTGVVLAAGASDNKNCDNSRRVTRTVSVSNFSGIDASLGVDVVYTPSSVVSATVEAPEALMPYVRVDQRGEMLNITIAGDNKGKMCGKVRVRLSAPLVNTYMVSTSAEVKVKGTVEAGNRNLTIKATTSGEVDIASVTCKDLIINADTSADVDIENVTARTVTATATTSGDIELKGETSVVTLTADTSGEIDASRLTAVSGTASANTSGTVECRVTGKFTNRTSTGGTVTNATY